MGCLRLCHIYRHEKGNEMKTITIHNQAEWDALPKEFGERTLCNIVGEIDFIADIPIADLYAWPDPQFPNKIAFRKCRVLHECDRYGEKI